MSTRDETSLEDGDGAPSPQAPPPPPQAVSALLDLFDGHFPGHTMQRVRTPDGRYRYTHVSPGVKQSFGLDPDALGKQESVRHEWVHSEDRSRFLLALERSAERLETLDIEVRVKVPGGRFKWVRSIGHPRRLSDGTVIWDGVALDVTDRREALQAVERSLSAVRQHEVSLSRLAAIAAQDVAVPFRRLQEEVAVLAAGGRSDSTMEALRELEQSLQTAFGLLGAPWPSAGERARVERPNEAAAVAPESAEEPAGHNRLEALTRRQREILSLVNRGLSNRAIAERTGLTEGTVKLHVSNILKRLGAKNRTEAVRMITEP